MANPVRNPSNKKGAPREGKTQQQKPTMELTKDKPTISTNVEVSISHASRHHGGPDLTNPPNEKDASANKHRFSLFKI